ncbi:hypothetical protein JHK87_012576 [Glycine soja]|nr:hypothetical protein JHK87_012576 [Glycine soja]
MIVAATIEAVSLFSSLYPYSSTFVRSSVSNRPSISSHLFSLMNASDSEKEDTEIEVIAITPNEENSKLMKKEKKKKKKVSLKDAEKKGGVCYMSRIPPHMDHVKLRHILSQFGDIQRIFLAPQDSSVQVPAKRSRGSQDQAYSEGWVEFGNKSVAKRVANMLNGEQIGGKKRSSFYYDLWNIKYLSKFKWDDLTEELALKKAIREQKLAVELSAAKRERDFYLSKVDQSRALSAIEERLKKNVEWLLFSSFSTLDFSLSILLLYLLVLLGFFLLGCFLYPELWSLQFCSISLPLRWFLNFFSNFISASMFSSVSESWRQSFWLVFLEYCLLESPPGCIVKQKIQKDSGPVEKVIRHFPQTKPIVADAKKNKPELSDDILDAVFGGSQVMY